MLNLISSATPLSPLAVLELITFALSASESSTVSYKDFNLISTVNIT
ncbi:hypothetical protein BHY_1399 (plasmid) [Borrelia nietonii YOR]|uniref:Uncharacterized protein n=2 Tax=Borrelia TaxID=138 RepID=W5SBR2_9SPIR|nr:hypothetical protein BHY_1399 [Borrelia nietonii YOR]AHH14474.1 hypothetical protein BHW_0900015 [Borrelia hermsii MTW]